MIQDGKKTRSDDCNWSDEIWVMSYLVIGGIISANTALVLEVSPLRKGRVDGEYSGTEQVVENNEWQGENQKLYSTGREKEEKGVLHSTWRKWKISFGIWLPGVAFDGMDFRKFYYAMAFYKKPDFCLNIMQRSERTSNISRRITDCNPLLEQRARRNLMVSMSRLRHQISSDDEDENLIISYTSDAQTRSPTNDSLPQERIR